MQTATARQHSKPRPPVAKIGRPRMRGTREPPRQPTRTAEGVIVERVAQLLNAGNKRGREQRLADLMAMSHYTIRSWMVSPDHPARYRRMEPYAKRLFFLLLVLHNQNALQDTLEEAAALEQAMYAEVNKELGNKRVKMQPRRPKGLV